VNISHGVAFDKDLILKILSQPNCEGIRCYFCAKGPDTSPQIKDTTNCAVSLVVVGIDANGIDLNWNTLSTAAQASSTTQAISGTDRELDLTDLSDDDGSSPSLAGEYGSPPPPTLEEKINSQNFVLLKNALSLI
jgi:hypothetical protein